MPFRFNPFTDKLDLTETGALPPGGGIQTITGTSGGAVGPNMANNVNLLGSGNISVTGNPGTNTLTISQDGTVATTYTANTGSATPSSGNLNVLATIAVAGTTPFTSTGSGSTITYTVQRAQAIASTNATNIGLSAFNSAQFSVDANGFVSLSGTGVGETITGNTGGALSPTAGNWNILGSSVAAGTTPVQTVGSGSTLTVDVQISQAIASTNATNVGLAAFNSAQFSVDANGFVSTSGTGILNTLTPNSGTSPVTPTGGTINVVGSGSTTTVGSANTVTVELTGLTNHAVLVGAGTPTITKVGPTATSGQILQSQGSTSDPAFSTATYPSTTTINQILYSSSANVVSGLATGNNGVLITSAAGVPSLLADGTTGQVLTATTGSPASWASPAASSISITGDTGGAQTGNAFTFTASGIGLSFAGATDTFTVGGILTLANGGTNANLTASNGGIFYSTATAGAILAGTATANQMLQSGASAAPAWSTSTWPATTTINQLLYSSSANTVAGLATANSAVLTTTAAGVPVWSGTMTNGQVIIGSTGATPTAATLTAGSGITITNSAGGITITATNPSGFPWTDVTGATQTLAVNNGYVTDHTNVTYTLPSTAALGDTIKIVGKLGITTIAQNANQQIDMSSASSTVGVGGSVAGTNVGDCIELICITAGASTVWRAASWVGNWTVT